MDSIDNHMDVGVCLVPMRHVESLVLLELEIPEHPISGKLDLAPVDRVARVEGEDDVIDGLFDAKALLCRGLHEPRSSLRIVRDEVARGIPIDPIDFVAAPADDEIVGKRPEPLPAMGLCDHAPDSSTRR
jgi:hypothetical protein